MKGDRLPYGWSMLGDLIAENADGDRASLNAAGNRLTFAYESMDGWVNADAPVEVVAALLRAAGWTVEGPGGREP